MQLADASGDVVKSYDYDAFGVERDPDPEDTNPFRYASEYFDAETGNYYLRARYYDPGTGRFLAEDPIRDGLNWYTYCGGNPVAFVDPSGLSFIDDMGAYFKEFGTDAKKFWDNFTEGNNQRFNKFWSERNIYTFADYMTYGMLSANEARGNAMIQNPNWYTVGNWMTSGTFDMINGAVNPDKPLSFDHWMNSLGTVSLAYGGYKGVQNIRTVTKSTAVVYGTSYFDDTVNSLKDWLGKDTKTITNLSGDKIFLSQDGLRRVRFDINRTYPHQSPHTHIEQLVNGHWVKSGPIYPANVLHK